MQVVAGPEAPGFASADVAAGFGCTMNNLRVTRARNAAELLEGKHWFQGFVDTPRGRRATTMWTQRGIVRLGFFLHSPRAREFRDWAEDLVLVEAGASAAIAPDVANLVEGIPYDRVLFMMLQSVRDHDHELGQALFDVVADSGEAFRAEDRRRSTIARAEALMSRHALALGR